MTNSNRTQIARLIDYALLQPTQTEADVVAGCELARCYATASVCVKPCHVARAAAELRGSGVLVSTVIAFPHGASPAPIKAAESALAIEQGARELDMVCAIHAVKGGDWRAVEEDISAVVRVCPPSEVIVKVILETCYLTGEEKVRVCQIAEAAGAAFVKTSTGFGPGGATVEDIRLMRSVVGTRLGVKASGGIRTRDDLLRMVQAGATRIGASALTAIMENMTT